VAAQALPPIEERAIDGNYGELYHNGHFQGDMQGFTGRLSIERRELPRAGTNQSVFRRGRVSRDGSVSRLKVDSRFEHMFIRIANLSEEEKRRARAELGQSIVPDTQLMIKLDDPDSWGAEEILLTGVKFWELPIGFTMNDMITHDLPVTWQGEELVKAIPRPHNRQGALGALPTGERTYAASGRDPDPVI
jgi:hypothetical protein